MARSIVAGGVLSVPAHVSVRLASTINDLSLFHVFSGSSGFVLIDPCWIAPHGTIQSLIESLTGSDAGSIALEFLVKRLVVHENPRVSMSVVETIFQLSHSLSHFIEVAVANQNDKGSVLACDVKGGLVSCVYDLARTERSVLVTDEYESA